MSFINRLPHYLRPRRAKLFTDGRQAPIDRNDRARVMALADAARRKREITFTGVEILRALMYKFANLKDGRCFPSHERIAEAAGCDTRTVGRCMSRLEAAGFLTWVNRLLRVRERIPGLPGIFATTWRVIRTSNAYDFPLITKATPVFPTKGQNSGGTRDSDTYPLSPDLMDTLNSFGRQLGYVK